MARQHKTMRGIAINMDTLRIKNEKVIAIGNMNVNAGGDILGPGGKIIKDRNQRIRDENALHTMVPGKAPVVAGKAAIEKMTSAQKAEKVEADAAAQILADAEKAADPSTPKGGLAAEMAETATPKKKKKATKKT